MSPVSFSIVDNDSLFSVSCLWISYLYILILRTDILEFPFQIPSSLHIESANPINPNLFCQRLLYIIKWATIVTIIPVVPKKISATIDSGKWTPCMYQCSEIRNRLCFLQTVVRQNNQSYNNIQLTWSSSLYLFASSSGTLFPFIMLKVWLIFASCHRHLTLTMNDNNSDCWKPQRCFNYENCTGSSFVPNWTEQFCVPQSVQEIRNVSLSVIGVVGIIGVAANVIVLSAFLYVISCKTRLTRRFIGREFTYMRQPIFVLICHLSICDLLYCLVGLPTYW